MGEIDAALELLMAEKEALDRVISFLKRQRKHARARRTLTPEHRAAIAARMRRYWDERRSAVRS